MTRDFVSALIVIGLAVPAVALVDSRPTQPPQAPANADPNQPAPTPAPGRDPAAVVFATEAGLVLHAVKPASVADYESVIVALQAVLSKAEAPEVRRVAESWRVFKAQELDAKSNVIFVHWLQPVQDGVDYRPSLWLDDLLAGAPPDLLAKYREAFAAPPSMLSLAPFAHMAMPPAVNATPEAPALPAPPPSNTSPVKPPPPGR